MKRLYRTVALAICLSACAPTQRERDVGLPPWSGPAGATARMSTAPSDAYLDVWVLDVGQGSCVYVDCPDGVRPLLVDCGSMSWGEDRNDRDTIAQWILDHIPNGQRLAVAITHPHQDHLSVLPRITRTRTENIITVGGPAGDYPATTVRWAGGESRLRDFAGTRPRFNDSRLSCGPRTQVDILAVNGADRTPPDNGNSLILAITFDRTAIVLPGDAEGSSEALALAVLNRDEDDHLPAPQLVLLSSHHGSDQHGSNDADWLRALQPNAIIFSANPDYATYRHPRCVILERAAPFVADASASSTLTCGTETTEPTSSRAGNDRMLSTYDNGTMRVRLTGTQVTIACEEMSAGCRTQLEESELPGAAVS